MDKYKNVFIPRLSDPEGENVGFRQKFLFGVNIKCIFYEDIFE